jgi:hypothetical protein
LRSQDAPEVDAAVESGSQFSTDNKTGIARYDEMGGVAVGTYQGIVWNAYISLAELAIINSAETLKPSAAHSATMIMLLFIASGELTPADWNSDVIVIAASFFNASLCGNSY